MQNSEGKTTVLSAVMAYSQ